MQLSKSEKCIFLAILDWGLGHASRCVSLIQQWEKEDKTVFVICSSSTIVFLKEECPSTQYLIAPAYNIRYPSASMALNMAWQGVRIFQTIFKEQQQLKKWVDEYQPDLIVSDGRFGCHHTSVKSIWLAHQLQIQHAFKPLANVLNYFYHQFIKKNYQEVWIPDFEGSRSLAGHLSLPVKNIVHQYLGALSRFSSEKIVKTPIKYQYLVLLSGPEPQRTYLESELLALLEQKNVPSLLVRGVTNDSVLVSKSAQVKIINCLYGDDLFEHIMAAEKLICRSGYSTLMDLYYWKKPALLIPTPGQTEQIYLAKYWAKKGWCEWQEQGGIEVLC